MDRKFGENEITLLHFLSFFGKLEEIDKQKTNFSQKTKNRWTIFHCAAASGSFNIISALYDEYRDICWEVDVEGKTPLHIAANYGSTEVIDFFLERN